MTALPTGSATVNRVLKGQLCTGCGLCAGVSDGALTMTTEAPGYARPQGVASVSAQNEKRIAAACPGAQVAPWTTEANRHISWGPWIDCMTGYATDPTIRHGGSSGGAISALAIHALRTGLVEKVLHIAPDPDHPTRNILAWSTTAEDVLDRAGSRYAASSPLATIDAALDEGRPFALIGKPCDISALRQLAKVDPRVDRIVPLTLSFFCGGLPSHAGADRIIRSMGLQPDEVTAFRYRGNGWPGLTIADTADGRQGTMQYEHSWGGHLSKEVQFRCKICPDAVGGVADIACADAWYGGESGYPQFEEQAGRSLIMTRTDRGSAFLNDAMSKAVVEAQPLNIAEIDLMQPSQARRKRLVAARLMACRLTAQPVPRMKQLCVGEASRTAAFTESLKNMLGTIRRITTNSR
ncbi:Coenzyme F420 hydrogenase/dehydrogenase, beta subunit C-terminal domain [Sphingobium sufflavum]|uniref:Coenzyme F420 hydrogenase/dehydrogenase, beta subunit C-terminal domain n=1 Tax=Sphingobium sufflavum TaxID=1129547 RepID=UPI001F36AEA4|nr:Coenzyme F420 hydrogenase/dehydrogenase, beta subunit C-terminal domain [Sphingobium sufflavum]MCE7798530.1 Coenzyme F420 hydrogenase/dehydrogenase, beta subunit C-terminal domain [Sphingobium sufflavum]